MYANRRQYIKGHQAASNGDPRGGDREHLHFYIGTHPNTFFNEHVLV